MLGNMPVGDNILPLTVSTGVVPASEVATILELPPSNLQLLLDTIAALYPDLLDLNIENVSATLVPVNCLCLFLLAQLYGKEQHRPEAMDHWPEAAVPSSPDGGSPTRAGSRSPTGVRLAAAPAGAAASCVMCF
jgi:hypothetical protein